MLREKQSDFFKKIIWQSVKDENDIDNVANDLDSEINDRDDFIKNILQEQTTLLGYDPVGLNDNLEIAEGAINAELLQEDYVATHTFGWTEFDIDAETQQLRVTTLF